MTLKRLIKFFALVIIKAVTIVFATIPNLPLIAVRNIILFRYSDRKPIPNSTDAITRYLTRELIKNKVFLYTNGVSTYIVIYLLFF